MSDNLSYAQKRFLKSLEDGAEVITNNTNSTALSLKSKGLIFGESCGYFRIKWFLVKGEIDD